MGDVSRQRKAYQGSGGQTAMTRHELRVMLRLLVEVMRERKIHRRMRHAITRMIERSYG